MKLNNKASYEMTEEIALSDSELETVLGGQGLDCSPQSSWNSGYPSYGSGYPSYGSGCGNGAPSYNTGYPSYNTGYPSYNTGNCGGSTPSYSTITYSVTVPANSSNPCNGGY